MLQCINNVALESELLLVVYLAAELQRPFPKPNTLDILNFSAPLHTL